MGKSYLVKKGNPTHGITASVKGEAPRGLQAFPGAAGKAGLCVPQTAGHPPIGKLLNALIGEGPFCSSGVAWGMTFSRKDFMEG